MNNIVPGCRFMIINSRAGNNGMVGVASHTTELSPEYPQALTQSGPIWLINIDIKQVNAETGEYLGSSRTIPESLMLRIDDFDAKASDMRVYKKDITKI